MAARRASLARCGGARRRCEPRASSSARAQRARSRDAGPGQCAGVRRESRQRARARCRAATRAAVPAHLARIRDETAARRRQRRHLPDLPRVPRRRTRPPAQPRVHHDRVVPPGLLARGAHARSRRAGARAARRRDLPVEFAQLSRSRAAPRGLRSARCGHRANCSAPRRRWALRRARTPRSRPRRAAGSHRRRARGSGAGRRRAHLRASLSGLAGRAGAARSATIRASRCASSSIIAAWSWPMATTSSRVPPSSACDSRRTSSRAGRAACPRFELDAHLLAALDAGLPDCAGVALGFDRVLMLAAGRREHR